MKNERLEKISYKIQCGEPVGLIEAMDAIEYQEYLKRKDRKMWASIIPFIWYIAGSICFAVGSIISIYRIVKGL